jgi:hypothetical protein
LRDNRCDVNKFATVCLFGRRPIIVFRGIRMSEASLIVVAVAIRSDCPARHPSPKN